MRVKVKVPPHVAEQAILIPGVRYDPKAGWIVGPPEAVSKFGPMLATAPARTPTAGMYERLEHAKRVLDLRNYQDQGCLKMLEILSSRSAAICADDMGLGKTREACAVAYSVGAFPVIMVVPASVKHQWVGELKLLGIDPWCPESGAECRTGPLMMMRREPGNTDWCVVSYALAIEAADWYRRQGRPVRTVLFDEMQMFSDSTKRSGNKKDSSKRAQAAQQMAAFASYRIGLTGTPIPNLIRDMWRPLMILFGTATWGGSREFDVRYCKAGLDGNGHWKNNGRSNEEELRERLAPLMVRRLKSDVAKELPSITRTFRWVEPTTAAKAALYSLQTGARNETAYHQAVAATLEAKMGETVQACLEAGKFLCLTWLRTHAHALAEMLTAAGADVEVLTGELTPRARQLAIKAAVARGASIVATGDSVGTGTDGIQHVASTGVMHALIGKPGDIAQREARLHRMGQLNPVTWIYVGMRESIDETVIDTAIAKLGDWTRVIPGAENDTVATGLTRDFEAAWRADPKGAMLRALFDSLPDGGDDGGE